MALATSLALLGIAATSASAFQIERSSVASDGSEANASSTTSAVSADGRFVAFVSGASNLVPGDTNSQLDVFVHDRMTGTTERASVSSAGVEASGQSAGPVLSADGRYVAFASQATNLVAGDTNGRFDVFVRDRMTGTTERVSLAADGAQGDLDSIAPAISADGRFVAFASAASNLVAADGNGSFDIFVRDRVDQTTVRVSTGPGGSEGNNLSLAPRISADGSVVVFHSFASNLVAGDTNGVADVFAHDLATGMTERASVASNGTQGNQQSVGAQVSADGRFVVFDSDASTLVANDVNGRTDVFVHDRVSGATEIVSVASDGTAGNNRSGFVDPPSISADGRMVAFTSGANNLVPGDTNNVVDVMLHDRMTGETKRINVAVDGTEADGASTLWTSMSADGRVVIFASAATNLVAGDTNFVQDIFDYVDTCGNGSLEIDEECDDGNTADDDCCSSTCTLSPAGNACDDGDLCTRSDACDSAGACVGSDPVVCDPASGQCDAPATCDPESGACVSDPLPPGAACDDGNLCTRSDTCDGAGNCLGSDPVLCEGGSGQCSSPGACDPTTGACVGGSLPDGSACDDGDACTVEDVCMAGVCEPGEFTPSACVSSFQCYHSFSWRKPEWWFSSTKVLVEDLFERSLFNLGSTASVCSAIAPPAGQVAKRLACVRLRRASGFSRVERDVRVVNTFGDQMLRVGKAERLCLPAGSTEVPADPGLDAFKCYDAETRRHTPRFKSKTVTLTDEFGRGTVDVVAPDMLCNPASVAGSELVHEAAHLVCYRVAEHWRWGRKDFFLPRKVSLVQPFGSDLVTLLWREHLCVPSEVVESH